MDHLLKKIIGAAIEVQTYMRLTQCRVGLLMHFLCARLKRWDQASRPVILSLSLLGLFLARPKGTRSRHPFGATRSTLYHFRATRATSVPPR